MLFRSVPLSDKKLLIRDWGFLIDKFGHKLQGWKGQSLSLGGRITMINAVLSSVPLYTLSLYRLPKKVLTKIDQIRRQFLWQGTGLKKKYHLLNWPSVCLTKEFGGMGILDLEQMNCALLLKWWWRVNDPQYMSLWKEILLANLHSSIPPSHFWKGILHIAHIGELGVSKIPGSQGQVLFWTDTWFQNCPLSITFYNLFSVCRDPTVSAQEVVTTQGRCLRFRRGLTGVLLHEWHQVLELINSLAFTHGGDQMAWQWTSHGKYTVQSVYQFLNFRGVRKVKPLLWWKLPVPPKIRAFVWLLHKKKILTKVRLQERGWDGDVTCQFCASAEDVNHLFFHCYFANHIWFHMGLCQDISQSWQSLDDVVSFALTLSKIRKTAFLIVVSAVLWCIWRQRNDLCFNNSIHHSGRLVILQIVSIVSYWTGQFSEEMRHAVQEWMPPDLDAVPLQVAPPEMEQMIGWLSEDST